MIGTWYPLGTVSTSYIQSFDLSFPAHELHAVSLLPAAYGDERGSEWTLQSALQPAGTHFSCYLTTSCSLCL